MSNKLFVGGISWNTSDQGLAQAFEPFGDVIEAKIITDRDTGRSRGFGFVTMGSADEARDAISQMDGASLDAQVGGLKISAIKAAVESMFDGLDEAQKKEILAGL